MTVITPVVEGDVCFVASGGACPGLEHIAREIYSVCREVSTDSVPVRAVGARGGSDLILRAPENALTLFTSRNLRFGYDDSPPVSFGTRGFDGEHETLLVFVRNLVNLGVRYLIYWGGDNSLLKARDMQRAVEAVFKETGIRLYVAFLVKSMDDDFAGLSADQHAIGCISAAYSLARTLRGYMIDARRSDTVIHGRAVLGNQSGFFAETAARLAKNGLVLIPELFLHRGTTLQFLVDIVLGAFAKRALRGVRHLVPVIAEGVIDALQDDQLDDLAAQREALAANGDKPAAKHVQFCERLTELLEAGLRRCRLDNDVEVKLRTGLDGHSDRGANANQLDRQSATHQARRAVEEVLQGNSNILVVGAGEETDVRNFADTFVDDAVPTRQHNLEDPAVRKHWEAGRSERLIPSDLEDGGDRRLADLLGLEIDEFHTRFTPVAEWGAYALERCVGSA